MKNKKDLSLTTVIILIGLVLFLVFYFTDIISVARIILGVITPLLIGAGMAFILNILIVSYEKMYFPKSTKKFFVRTRRNTCVVFAILTVVLIVSLFLVIVIPQLGQSILLLTDGFPVVYNRVILWAKENSEAFPTLQEKLNEINMDGAAVLQKGLDLLGTWALGAASLVGSVFGELANYFLGGIFAMFILFSKDKLKVQMTKLIDAYLKTDTKTRFYEILRTANESFSCFIIGQFKEAIVLGTLCTVGMWIFRFPYATIVGPLIGLTALIPIVGAFIGAAVGVILILIVDPVKAAFFIIFIVALQQVEGNLIYPRIVGKSIGLPGVWLIAAITIGGGLLGILGVFLGVPIAATVFKLLEQSVDKRLTQQALDG
ncbi:MAG: AI-2E family transporter [Saccharofermentanales bacterium]